MTTIEEAVARKYPEQVALVSSISKDGKPNVMPAGWVMFTSHKPLLIAVSVAHRRYTHDLLLETGEFVIAFPSFEMARAIAITGSKSGKDSDKLAECDLKLVPAEKVRARLVQGAVANLECKLHSHHVTGDHTIFVGEVVAGHVGGPQRSRVMNFGFGDFAVALMDPERSFHLD